MNNSTVTIAVRISITFPSQRTVSQTGGHQTWSQATTNANSSPMVPSPRTKSEGSQIARSIAIRSKESEEERTVPASINATLVPRPGACDNPLCAAELQHGEDDLGTDAYCNLPDAHCKMHDQGTATTPTRSASGRLVEPPGGWLAFRQIASRQRVGDLARSGAPRHINSIRDSRASFQPLAYLAQNRV
jgi:hypothetical protein